MGITLVGIPAAFSTLALGLGPLATISDFVLKRKHEAMDRYWNQMLEYCQSEGSTNRDAARWLHAQRVALASGKLCRERATKLELAGLATSDVQMETLATLSEEQDSFAFAPTALERVIYAGIAAAGPLVLAASGASIESILVECYLSLVLTFILICDMRARIIPYQACIAYGVGSLVWVLLAQSFNDAFAAMALALVSALTLALTERAALHFTSVSAIGAGDRRLIPLICFQIGVAGFVPGLIGLCLVAGAMAIAALVKGESKRSYLPFAPALVAFAAVGTLWPYLPTLW